MTDQTKIDDGRFAPLVPLDQIDPSELDLKACRALWSSVFYQSLQAHFEAGRAANGQPYDNWVASRDFKLIAELLDLSADRLRAWVAVEWTRPHPGRSLGGWGARRRRDNHGSAP